MHALNSCQGDSANLLRTSTCMRGAPCIDTPWQRLSLPPARNSAVAKQADKRAGSARLCYHRVTLG